MLFHEYIWTTIVELKLDGELASSCLDTFNKIVYILLV